LNHEIARGLANVDAVIAVGGMADDSLVFFVECIHGRPGERDPSQELLRMAGQAGVLPRPAPHALVARANGVPGSEAEVGVLCGMADELQSAWSDVRLLEVGHGIVARFEEQDDVLGINDPASAKAYTHASA